jgi:hypothetical protein
MMVSTMQLGMGILYDTNAFKDIITLRLELSTLKESYI